MFVPRIGLGDAFTLRAELRHIRPAIWRRLRVPAHFLLADLHDVLQTVFGWTDSHLHAFQIGKIEFGDAENEDERLIVDELGAPLGAVLGRDTKFSYHYDFGDDWELDIKVEAVTKPDDYELAECLAGERAGPPEDCGGPHRYPELLAALASAKHPEHRSMREWIGKRFNPEKLDLTALNKKLKTLGARIARSA